MFGMAMRWKVENSSSSALEREKRSREEFESHVPPMCPGGQFSTEINVISYIGALLRPLGNNVSIQIDRLQGKPTLKKFACLEDTLICEIMRSDNI